MPSTMRTNGPSDAASEDEKFLVRDPRQVRMLLQSLADQRTALTAHPDGSGQSFPSAVLEVDEDGLLLDGSPIPSVNQRAGGAGYWLCLAQVDRVQVRFRVERPQRTLEQECVAFRAALPASLHHLQRREFYRLETPVNESPWCIFPDPDGGEPLRWRVTDISAGGIAVLLPQEDQVLELQRRYPGCALELPDGERIEVALIVCSLVTRTRADGQPQQRAGLKFAGLPRGADAMIQRHIFRIERQRLARLNGQS
ncbi:MAG: flagellar brake protein [Gammaproteobacteria bacterium]|nr:flagellar brake protein [Gammaproteobacteria bacterium]